MGFFIMGLRCGYALRRYLYSLWSLNGELKFLLSQLDVFWGLPPAAGATFRSSQVCSALRRLQRLGLALRAPAAHR
ncbi:hypothetical protein SGRA_2462 [Saprospira grandis str. Lewin]|uniref:Uncharacterized protein n=1 Tax=Saprospira grandis (strain Lewin) TaxID=984262 RepID=H6L5H4_SAPGL|nr:hypothetical protein SGRA_2462 [Saprospira grandis str. Lewin]